MTHHPLQCLSRKLKVSSGSPPSPPHIKSVNRLLYFTFNKSNIFTPGAVATLNHLQFQRYTMDFPHICTSPWNASSYLIPLKSSYSSSKTQPKYCISWETSSNIPSRVCWFFETRETNCWPWPTGLLYPTFPALCTFKPRTQREKRTQI